MNRPVHFEIHANDPDRAQAFYSGLFGWTFTKWGDGAWDYWMIKTGEGAPGIDGGMIRRMGEDPNKDTATPVIAYVCTIGVDDVDASVARAIELGACVAVPKMAIKGVGWLAYCKDTEGNLFGVMCDDTSAA